MSTTPNDIFHLNPPRAFTYTDFVVHAPRPRIPRGMTHQDTKKKYPRTRLKRLVRLVDARLGKHRCFFSEVQSGDRKKASQFEVTNLYALHEVEHWPEVMAQYEWTQFVMQNMERDAAMRNYGVNLALPTIPPSAWRIHRKMLESEGGQRASDAIRTAQINGAIRNGEYELYSGNDPRRHEIPDRVTARHFQNSTTFGSNDVAPSALPVPALRKMTSEQFEELVHDDKRYEGLLQFHVDFVRNIYKKMFEYFKRHIGRQLGMHTKTWEEVQNIAREHMKHNFGRQLQLFRYLHPRVQFPAPVTVMLWEAQLQDYLAYARYKDPVPEGASPQIVQDYNRKHELCARSDQRQTLRQWLMELQSRVGAHTGVRYRRETNCIADFWTGDTFGYAAFDERNRQEGTGLTAAMLPLAAQRFPAPRVELRSDEQIPAPVATVNSVVQSESKVQEDEETSRRTDLLQRMKEKARLPSPPRKEPAQAIDPEQSQVVNGEIPEARGDAAIQAEVEVDIQNPGATEIITSLEIPAESQSHSVELRAMPMTNAASPEKPKPPHAEDGMDVDNDNHDEIQAGEQAQGLEIEHAGNGQSQVSSTGVDEFQTQVWAAAQDDVREMSLSQTMLAQRLPPGNSQEPVSDQLHKRRASGAGFPESEQVAKKVVLAEEEPAQEALQKLTSIGIQEEPQDAAGQDELQSASTEAANHHETSSQIEHAPTETVAAQEAVIPAVTSQEQTHPPMSDAVSLPQNTDVEVESQNRVLQTHEVMDQDLTPNETLEPDQLTTGRDGKDKQSQDAAEQSAESESAAPPTTDESTTSNIEDLTTVDPAPPTEPKPALPEPLKASNLSLSTPLPKNTSNTAPSIDATGNILPSPSSPTKKCHRCTTRKTRCNGERPCQFCTRDEKACYQPGCGPPRKGNKSRKTKDKETKLEEKQEQEREDDDVRDIDENNDQAREEVLELDSAVPPAVASETQETTKESTEANQSNLTPVESSLHASPSAEDTSTTTNPNKTQTHPEALRQTQPKVKSSTTQPKKSTTRATKRRSNVTTRGAEQQAAKDAKRSLRAMPHRDVSK